MSGRGEANLESHRPARAPSVPPVDLRGRPFPLRPRTFTGCAGGFHFVPGSFWICQVACGQTHVLHRISRKACRESQGVLRDFPATPSNSAHPLGFPERVPTILGARRRFPVARRRLWPPFAVSSAGCSGTCAPIRDLLVRSGSFARPFGVSWKAREQSRASLRTSAMRVWESWPRFRVSRMVFCLGRASKPLPSKGMTPRVRSPARSPPPPDAPPSPPSPPAPRRRSPPPASP